ncbi:MAG: endonuclease/exonuclease/phosphatase family protein [Polyangiaceae bacterium]|nr:endonuclease/exonuclease/phosphatase family protein [Polyangiaceae bacterium]
MSIGWLAGCRGWAAGSGGVEQGGGGQGGEAGKPPLPPIQFRVVTLNVQNMFNDRFDDTPPLGQEEVVSAAEYKSKLEGVAAILTKMNPDFVMLQEVEGDAVLKDLQERPEFQGRFVDRATFSGNDPRGIDIAALSTVPLTKKISHKNDQFALAGTGGSDKYRFARDLLEVHAEVNGRNMIFLGVHLKAKSNDDPQKRLAEAQHARYVADQLRLEDPSAAVIILGDFNDFPGSPPMDAVEGKPPGEVFQSMGLQLDGSLAWTVFTQSTASGKALHDDLRVSPWLFERLVKGSVKILHDDQLDAPLRNISDHAPVAATFQIN